MTSPQEDKNMLSPEQYRVLKESGTEQPFANAYWDNKREGIYVDPISGAPLFSSKDKFDSGTGWPSFSKTLENAHIVENTDTSHGMTRQEVRSQTSDSHLGHVFDDGPSPANKRYCINSAALRFIGVENLEEEGYGQYLSLFGRVADPGAQREVATFGAGCFWGVQAAFQKVLGVTGTRVGFTGGGVPAPTYEKVCSHATGHAEAVRVVYDPSQVSYGELLKVFWRIHDPTAVDRQGPDIGSQYRSVIFYHTPGQHKTALASKAALESSGVFHKPIATEILPAQEFWEAEEYHQDYYKKRSLTHK